MDILCTQYLSRCKNIVVYIFVGEIENKQNNNGSTHQSGPWWKPAMQIFSEVSTWIVTPIVLTLIVGKALDNHYGTKPVIFLCLTGFGFLVTCFGLYKAVKNYIKKLQDINTDKGEDKIN